MRYAQGLGLHATGGYGSEPQTGSGMPFAVQHRACTPPESTAKRTYLFPAGILPQIFGQLLGMLARKQYMTRATP